ncbi:MAG: lipocalin family protein [Pseudomonadota bacterium]|nr:lipocalin family protein [Pseudomonadota bacterium]
MVAGQEPEFALRYWGGTVTVAGAASGSGYVELTGYGG